MKPRLFFTAFLVLGLLLVAHDSVPAQDTDTSPEWGVATSLTYLIAPQLIIGLKL